MPTSSTLAAAEETPSVSVIFNRRPGVGTMDATYANAWDGPNVKATDEGTYGIYRSVVIESDSLDEEEVRTALRTLDGRWAGLKAAPREHGRAAAEDRQPRSSGEQLQGVLR